MQSICMLALNIDKVIFGFQNGFNKGYLSTPNLWMRTIIVLFIQNHLLAEIDMTEKTIKT